MDELANVLDDVSRNCLRGQPVPGDLAALWRAQLNDETELIDAYELTLFDGIDPDLFEGFRAEDGVEIPVAAAFDRMARQICWVAEAMDGSLLGYWVGEQQRAVAESPVVVCDTDGQFEIGAMTIAEYLLDNTDPEDPEDFGEVREGLLELGIAVDAESYDAIWQRVEEFEDPNALVMSYLVEERMRG